MVLNINCESFHIDILNCKPNCTIILTRTDKTTS